MTGFLRMRSYGLCSFPTVIGICCSSSALFWRYAIYH